MSSRCEIARQTRCKAVALEVVVGILILLHVPSALTIFQGNMGALVDIVAIALLGVGLAAAWRRSRKLLTVHFVVQAVLMALMVAVTFLAMVVMVVALVAVAMGQGNANDDGTDGAYGPAGNTTAVFRVAQMQKIIAGGVPMSLGHLMTARSPAVKLAYNDGPMAPIGDSSSYNAPPDQDGAALVAAVVLVMFVVGVVIAVFLALQIANLVLTWKLRTAIRRIETAAAAAAGDSTELPMVAAAAPMGAYLPVSTTIPAPAPMAAAAPQQVFYTIAPNGMVPPQYAAGFQPAYYLPAGQPALASAPGDV